MTTMTMDAPNGEVLLSASPIDNMLKQEILPKGKDLPGFAGARRLVGIGESVGKYIQVTYWDSHGTLLASKPGLEFTESKKDSVGTQEDTWSSMKIFAKAGTDLSTHVFSNEFYERSRTATPYFEAGSPGAAIFQLVCIALGVGIFQMPSVFAAVGPFMGCVLVAAFSIFSDFCLQILLHCADKTGAGAFEE